MSLPLFPHQYQAVKQIDSGTCYACMHCGYIDNISKPNQTCARCECDDWAQAINVEVIE
ncbi:hypothetical protein [Psychrobacter sp. LV10R520-6]|uniref:hypothetical protein n=1 Tax=Psychrobacter sp. LV10R520-6 TaxID=1415574 RepID=UPI002AA0AF5E|nr:hypothetical protein [Psychrobacter sp. LV10R520-6]